MAPQTAPPAPTGLLDIIRQAGESLRAASGADIITLYLFDSETRQYFAPVALGIPETDLAGSIPDMQDQLARYDADLAQGKAPQQLRPADYGPNVWLTVSQQPLVVPDTVADLNTSFVRRHRIRSIVGLPLLAGGILIGILYLDFVSKQEGDSQEPVPALEGEALAQLQERSAEAGQAIQQARQAEERAAFVATAHLATHLTAAAVGGGTASRGLHEELADALIHLLEVTNFDAALVYQAQRPGHLDLIAQHGIAGAPVSLALEERETAPDASATGWDPQNDPQLQRATSADGLTVALALPLHVVTQPPVRTTPRAGVATVGWLLILSHDLLAFQRRTPATRLLLESAAELIAGALAGERLFLTLEHANRVLGALGRLSGAMLQPGATRQQVLDAVVRHLIDPEIPEFAFQFATIFLLADAPPTDALAPLSVRMAAGATADERIDARPLGTPSSPGTAAIRVPSWAQLPNRVLGPDDVLTYVARQRQIVIVGPLGEERDGEQPEYLTEGYPPEQVAMREVHAVHADGSTGATVPAVLVRGQGDAGRQGPSEEPEHPFTLDAEIFDASRHGDLLRIFLPFGITAAARANGVLEVGYHRAQRRTIERTQVEALRAAAAQVAVAVETARLYEETKRHAEQLEIIADVSKAMASSIDLDQTLRIVAKCLERSVAASFCQIALYEEDGSAWYGAAASVDEALWRRQRGERSEGSFLFDLLETRAPLVVADAQDQPSVNPYYARLFGIRSLLALPLIARGHPIGAAILGQRDDVRTFTPEEVQRAEGLSHQAAIAIQNARTYASAEEDPHIQRDVVLVGFGEWGHKAYEHLLTLKQFFNFKIHIVERDTPGRRQVLESKVAEIVEAGDAVYWDSANLPGREQLRRELESSCYVITYIATPAPTHLAVLAQYYDLSNIVVIEKPLGAPVEAYREFLDSVEAGVQIVAADHYYFKLEVRLLHLLLTEERTLKSFLDDVEEIEIELIEERPLSGAAVDIGIIEDMLPHAFAIVSLFTPIDRIQFDAQDPVTIARQEPPDGSRETYARICATFPHRNRNVRLVIDVGKGVENSKWIKLAGEKRLGGRPAFYKFDFAAGQAIDGTQTNLRAATRAIRQPGVPDNAHLTMLRHVIEKRYPAVGILAIREAMRSNQRIGELADLAADLLAKNEWTSYRQGQRPQFPDHRVPRQMDETRQQRAKDQRVG
ncbi:MAG: GAF domain-containing protein [Chloroflexota bacterium]